MNFNSGTRLVFIIFLVVIVILFVLLILVALIGKKKRKVPVILKVFTILFTVLSIAGGFVFPFTYYCNIPLNLKYGRFMGNGTPDYLVVHHDSVELHENGESRGLKGTYSIKNDVLEITYKDGTVDKLIVKHFGAELVDPITNMRAYYYTGDKK